MLCFVKRRRDMGRTPQQLLWTICNLIISALFLEYSVGISAAAILNNSQHNITVYYINTNEMPGELSRKKLISSHVKILPLLWLHNRSRLSHQKTIKVKWFGILLVFI